MDQASTAALADAFAAVCAYHTSIQTALKQLRFIEFMQPSMYEGSSFRVDPELLKNMITELVRIQNIAGGGGMINHPAPADAQSAAESAAESWSDGSRP
jgi:hypothetical protein